MKPLRMPELVIPQSLIYDDVLTELGPLFPTVDTDFVLLMSQAVLAMAERAP